MNRLLLPWEGLSVTFENLLEPYFAREEAIKLPLWPLEKENIGLVEMTQDLKSIIQKIDGPLQQGGSSINQEWERSKALMAHFRFHIRESSSPKSNSAMISKIKNFESTERAHPLRGDLEWGRMWIESGE